MGGYLFKGKTEPPPQVSANSSPAGDIQGVACKESTTLPTMEVECARSEVSSNHGRAGPGGTSDSGEERNQKLGDHWSPAYEVLTSNDLFDIITSSQRGMAYKDWTSGDFAAKFGHMELIKEKAKEQADMYFSTDAMDWAAAAGNVRLLRWLDEMRDEGCTSAALDSAAGAGHLEVVCYLHDAGYGASTDAMDMAAWNGNLEMLKWLHDYRDEGAKFALEMAAENGHYDCVVYLCENRREVVGRGQITNAIALAEKHGHTDVHRYLFDFTTDTIMDMVFP